MQFTPKGLRHARLVVAVALFACAVLPSAALSQCSISGPNSLCGGSAQLCAPAGTETQWTGPNGFTSNASCITASVPGTYTLRVFDNINGLWSAPCSHTLTAGSGAPTASISGPSSGCTGSTAELCGPTGDFTYAWSGPAGFQASTACVAVSAAGTYSLIVTASSGGCPSAPATHDITFAPCGGSTVNCPRPAWFWAQQCPNDRHARFTKEQLAAIAACVDDHSQIFAWSDPSSAMCNALRRWKLNLRERAKRQFLAVQANVCANELQSTGNRGMRVGLDRSVPFVADFGRGTVGSWIDATDQLLVSLEGRSLRDRAVERAYRGVIVAGWLINHGKGVGAVCHETSSEQDADDESLAEALGDEGVASGSDVMLEFERPSPNPFNASTRIGYAVSGVSDQQVEIGVYDLAGREVRSLVRGPQAPGRHEAQWDGRESDGSPARNGVYFVHGRVGDVRVETRVMLVR